MLFHPIYGIKAKKVWAKVLVSCRKGKQILDKRISYIGKVETRHINERTSDHNVMQLMRSFLNKGRNVKTINYFTSVRLATQLKENRTSLLRTVNKFRQDVPLF